MDAANVGVDETCGPWGGGGSGVFEPEGFTGGERTQPVEVAIAIDVKALAVDALACSARERVKEGFLPIGPGEEADFAGVAGDDIDLAISGVVAGGGGGDDAAFVFADEVFFPEGSGGKIWQEGGEEEGGEREDARMHGTRLMEERMKSILQGGEAPWAVWEGGVVLCGRWLCVKRVSRPFRACNFFVLAPGVAPRALFSRPFGALFFRGLCSFVSLRRLLRALVPLKAKKQFEGEALSRVSFD